MESTDWYLGCELTCMPAGEAASHGECTTGWEPTATGYAQRYNDGTGTLTAPVVFTKYTGNTCVAAEEATCGAEL